MSAKRFIRRPEVLEMTGLSNTTIKVMEKRGDFPKHFMLSPRCAVWDLADVETWMEARKTLPPPPQTALDIQMRTMVMRKAAQKSVARRRERAKKNEKK